MNKNDNSNKVINSEWRSFLLQGETVLFGTVYFHY